MNNDFKKLIDKLPNLLRQLEAETPVVREELKKVAVPVRGVYVFYDRGKPIYVGSTNRMKKRLMEHGRAGSKHNDASFAYQLAKSKSKKNGIIVPQTRNSEYSREFVELFTRAKADVAKMKIRFVEIKEDDLQYLFEIYAARALRTKFNDFGNH